MLPTKYPLLLLLSYVSAYLNLFNLLPIRPLDGGRVVQVAGAWTKWVGFGALLAFSFYLHQPLVFYIWILALVDLTMRARLRFALSSACLATMSTLMLAGFSDQGALVDAIDCFFGFLVTLGAYFRTKKPEEEEEAPTAPRPAAPRAAKFRWLARYALLVAALGGLMAHQSGAVQATVESPFRKE